MSKPWNGSQDAASGRAVYYPATRWRIFAFLFPAFGIGMFIVLLNITWASSIESADLTPLVMTLVTGLIIVSVCVWVFYLLFWGVRLVISPLGIAYGGGGYTVATTWDNVVGPGELAMGSTVQQGLRLNQPAMRASFLILFGMVTAPRYKRMDPAAWSRFIPLTMFRPDWQNDPLGAAIKRYAPQCFGGQPPAPAIAGSNDPWALFGERRVPLWVKILGVAAVEAVVLFAALLYAGGQTMLGVALGGSSGAQGIAFSPDSTTLASNTNGLSLWRVPDGALERNFPFGNTGHIAYSPDGGTIATSDSIGSLGETQQYSIALVSTESGALVRRLQGQTNLTSSLLFSPDVRLVIAGSWTGQILVWQVSTGALLYTFTADSQGYSPIPSAALADGGSTLVAEFGNGKPLLWSLKDGRSRGPFQTDVDFTYTMAGRADGKVVALARLNGGVEVVDSHGASMGMFQTEKTANSVALSPDGRLLAAGLEDGSVRLWRIRDGALVRSFVVQQGNTVQSVAISPDDRALAASSLYALKLWDISRLTP